MNRASFFIRPQAQAGLHLIVQIADRVLAMTAPLICRWLAPSYPGDGLAIQIRPSNALYDADRIMSPRPSGQRSLRGIPAEAHTYAVNGRTPLEWLIDRYRIARDRQSGIVNDPNAWFDDPRALPTAFRRIVHLSTETTRIVAALPEAVAVGAREHKERIY